MIEETETEVVIDSKQKRQTRIQQKTNHIRKQIKIAKQSGVNFHGNEKEPHRLAKVHALNCGRSTCVMCGNPRKFFKETTIQEKKAAYLAKEITYEG